MDTNGQPVSEALALAQAWRERFTNERRDRLIERGMHLEDAVIHAEVSANEFAAFFACSVRAARNNDVLSRAAMNPDAAME